MADNFAHEITGPGSDLFRVVDLNAGVFTPVGNLGLTVAGRARPANAGEVLA